jgi:phage anti-repressor protein
MDLRKFLKKFSTLNNDFIDDFYNIYDPDIEHGTDYPIDILIVSKWLNSRKGTLKDTLMSTYTKHVDYIISREDVDSRLSKSNKEIIKLTPDCFKRLCLLSKTAKAEEVRTYFIELEKLIWKYKNYVIEGLEKTIKVLENNQKEISPKIKGVVYVLRSPKDIDGIYRFGQTEDFKKRLSNYNSANSDKMEVVYIYETKNSKKIQDCVIAQVKQHRYKRRKDFFQIDINILKSIINECTNMTKKFGKSLNNRQNGGGASTLNLFLYIDAIKL